MYEYGLRVGQELSNLKGLQQQAKCYLAMLNALRLVNPKYAWIVKPIPSTKQVHVCVGACVRACVRAGALAYMSCVYLCG